MGIATTLNEDFKVQIYRNRSVFEADIIMPDGTMVERVPIENKDMGNKIDYISTSRIDAFATCPSAFKQTFIDQTLDTSNVFTERGSLVHRCMELFVQGYMAGENNGTEVCLYEYMVKAFEESEAINDYETFQECYQMCKGFLSVCPVGVWGFKPLYTEHEFVEDFGNAHLSGIIDLLGVSTDNPEELVIVDYKSNFLPFSEEQLRNSLQLQLYSLVCKRLFPQYKKIKCIYFMLNAKTIQLCPNFSDETLAECEQYIKTVYDKISKESAWGEKLNQYCCYRECRFACKAYNEAIGKTINYGTCDYNVMDDEGLVRERERYYAIEKNSSRARKEIDRELKERITQRGAITDSKGYQYSVNAIKKHKIDYNKLQRVLLSHGRLDLLNGFVEISEKETDRFILLATKLDDLMLKLDIMGCIKNVYTAKAITKGKVSH